MDTPTLDAPNSAPELAPAIQTALARADELNVQVLAFVRARPLTCIAAAVTLGFVVGKIAARY